MQVSGVREYCLIKRTASWLQEPLDVYMYIGLHCNTNESRSTYLLKNDFALNKFSRPLTLSQHVFNVLAKAHSTNVLHSSSLVQL